MLKKQKYTNMIVDVFWFLCCFFVGKNPTPWRSFESKVLIFLLGFLTGGLLGFLGLDLLPLRCRKMV